MANQDFGTLTKGDIVLGKHHKVNSKTDTFKFSLGGYSNVSLLLDNLRTGRQAHVTLYADSNGNRKWDTGDTPLSFGTPVVGSSHPQEQINTSLFAGTYFAQVSRNSFVLGEARYNLYAQAF